MSQAREILYTAVHAAQRHLLDPNADLRAIATQLRDSARLALAELDPESPQPIEPTSKTAGAVRADE